MSKMATEKTYIAVFFDVALKAVPEEARQIRLDRKKFTDLVKEAVPGYNVQLEDRYGIVGNYTIVSRRSFHQKEPDTMFLIMDVKVISASPLMMWLNEQPDLQKVNTFFYRFVFNEKWCTGKISITPEADELTIMPNLNTIDIGNGPGLPVIKKFRRE